MTPSPDHGSAADIHRETVDLAKRLIACRSVTPADGGCLDIIAGRLTAAGFVCERLDRGGVANLWARHGRTSPVAGLAGHVDVVPSGPVEQWTADPFTPLERDGFLYGRGASDMKTSVAAMVTAAERVVAHHRDHRGSVALLLTSDEEGAAIDGAIAVVETLQGRGERIDWCVIGEPTSQDRLGDTIKNGRRGSLNGTLRVKGIQSHIAYPERGRNPVHTAAAALAELVSIEWDKGNAYFPPTSFQISNVHAGAGATNVIPGAMDVLFNFRFSPESAVEQLQTRVREILDRHAVPYELEWSVSGNAFMTPSGPLVETLSEAIVSVTGVVPALSTSGGTSDGRFLTRVAGEVVEFGPRSEGMHGIDERVKVADIGPLSEVYERTVLALLGLAAR
jgi:succinyl-diaminopimelate desuccinylase